MAFIPPLSAAFRWTRLLRAGIASIAFTHMAELGTTGSVKRQECHTRLRPTFGSGGRLVRSSNQQLCREINNESNTNSTSVEVSGLQRRVPFASSSNKRLLPIAPHIEQSYETG